MPVETAARGIVALWPDARLQVPKLTKTAKCAKLAPASAGAPIECAMARRRCVGATLETEVSKACGVGAVARPRTVRGLGVLAGLPPAWAASGAKPQPPGLHALADCHSHTTHLLAVL